MSRLTQGTLGVCLMAVVLTYGAAIAAYQTPTPAEMVVAGEKRVKENPKDFQASLDLAWDYMLAGRYDDAERELKRAEALPALADDHSQVREDRADNLLRQGKIDAAIAELRAAADEAKSNFGVWWALYRLAEVIRLYNRGGYADVCREMIDVGSGFPVRWSTPMVMLSAAGPPLGGAPTLHWEAVAALVACAGKGSGSAEVKARETMGPGLAEAVDAIPPKSPAYPAAAKALCWYYMDLGKLDLAAEAGERAVKLDPDHWLGHWLLAQCYAKQKKTDDALKQYQEMERTAGHQLDVAGLAARAIAGIYERAGHLDLAFDEYQKAIYAPGWQPDKLAVLAIGAGKARDALAWLQKNREQLLLVMTGRPDPAAWLGYNMAVLCAAVGNRDGMVANLAPFVQETAGGEPGELLQEAARAPDPAGRDLLLATFGAGNGFPPDQIRAYAEGAVAFGPDLPGANLFLAQLVAAKDPARAKLLATKALAEAAGGSAIAKEAQKLVNKLQGKA